MCGICGAIDLRGNPIPDLERRLEVMSSLIAHRGPDDAGIWTHERRHVGLGHRRLSIIDLDHGHQPMSDERGRWITYNGEIYNYPELRSELGVDRFRTTSDTEVALRAHDRWHTKGLERLRGMFAYALWDEPAQELICARDRFGIKPFYYATVGDIVYFASEAKALLPFLPSIETDHDALKDYLAFQFCLAGKTLFKGVEELLPGHFLRLGRGAAKPVRYWEVYFDLDFDHTDKYFEEQIGALLRESVELHLRSDVPVSDLPQRRARLERRRLAGQLALRGDDARLHREVLRGRALRRKSLRARAGRVPRPRATRGRRRRRGLHHAPRRRRLPPRLSRRRTWLVPAVHGLPGRKPARQGDPRRPGRR